MISAMLPSVKPMPAAAQPEYEFSIDTTTGMSAPPIGMMIRTPNSNDGERDRPEQRRRTAGLAEPVDQQHDQDSARACIDGVPHRQHDRLAGHAAGELQERDDGARERDGADGNAERHFKEAGGPDAARRVGRCRTPPAHRGHRPRRTPLPNRRANGTRPPAPASWSSECCARCRRRCRRRCRGRARSGTRSRRLYSPRPPSVVSTAMVMPIMPKLLPWRDVSGLDSPRSARMNSTPETRYSKATRLADMCAKGVRPLAV